MGKKNDKPKNDKPKNDKKPRKPKTYEEREEKFLAANPDVISQFFAANPDYNIDPHTGVDYGGDPSLAELKTFLRRQNFTPEQAAQQQFNMLVKRLNNIGDWSGVNMGDSKSPEQRKDETMAALQSLYNQYPGMEFNAPNSIVSTGGLGAHVNLGELYAQLAAGGKGPVTNPPQTDTGYPFTGQPQVQPNPGFAHGPIRSPGMPPPGGGVKPPWTYPTLWQPQAFYPESVGEPVPFEPPKNVPGPITFPGQPGPPLQPPWTPPYAGGGGTRNGNRNGRQGAPTPYIPPAPRFPGMPQGPTVGNFGGLGQARGPGMARQYAGPQPPALGPRGIRGLIKSYRGR